MGLGYPVGMVILFLDASDRSGWKGWRAIRFQ